MKRIVIIGNAKLNEDFSPLVDSADMAVRFNNARNYSSGRAGSKTDVLCIANKSHPGRKLAKYPIIKNLAFIPQVKTIWFPHFSDLKAAQFWLKPISRARFKNTNYCDWILLRNDLTDKDVVHFGKSLYQNARDELKITAFDQLEPSSGYMAVKYSIEHFSAELFEIIMLGFTFSGSNAHPWDDEKANISAWAEQGLVKILY